MSNVCKCGLEFGAPATLRIHERKCEFVAETPKEAPTKAPKEDKKKGKAKK